MKLTIFQPSDDFFTDRLCRRYGVLVFLAVAMVIARWTVLSPGTAMTCWSPSHFTTSHRLYVHEVCWNNPLLYKLYIEEPFLEMEPSLQELLVENSKFDLNKIKYLPVVLVLQVLVFLAPRAFWSTLGAISGFPTASVTKTASDVTKETAKDYIPLGKLMVSYLERPFSFLPGGISFGGYVLSIQYLISKLGYLIACIVQMAILTSYLGFNFFTYRFGSTMWERVSINRSYEVDNVTFWREEEPFPRTLMCDFQIRRLGNLQRYTIQCEMTSNEVVELGLSVIWLWLWFSFLLLGISTFAWVTRMAFYLIAPQSYKMARIAVLLGDDLDNHAPSGGCGKTPGEFANFLLKPDGALILEILEDNVSIAAASGVAQAAWRQYRVPGNRAHQGNDDVMYDPGAHAVTLPPSTPQAQADTIPLVQKA